MLRQLLVRPYEHVKHEPNSSLTAAAAGPVAEFSGFVNFKEKKRKSNLLMSFPKIVNHMGSFGEKRKKKKHAYLRRLSKQRRMAFFFLRYLF